MTCVNKYRLLHDYIVNNEAEENMQVKDERKHARRSRQDRKDGFQKYLYDLLWKRPRDCDVELNGADISKILVDYKDPPGV